MSRKDGAKNHNKRGALKADARSHDSFSKMGGHGCAGTDGCSPTIGIGSGGGGKTHHSAPKAKANVKPPDAHSYGSFSGVGGSVKSTNEY